MLKDLLITLSFISRLPINLSQIEDFDRRIKRIPCYFTLVGYLPGLIYFVTGTFSENLTFRIFGIAVGFYLFDLFHFDGLLDMFDGFLNQSDKEKRLQIMAKGDVGPFAVFYGTLYVIAFYNTFSILDPIDFAYASVFARYSMTILLKISKPAKSTGLGALLFPPCKLCPLIGILFSTPFLLFSRLKYLVSLFICLLTAFLVKLISERKIDGVTGDVIGGTAMLTQLFILLFMVGIRLWIKY
ncbi:MAG: adenosylcobinamide-GDP ribazoletransferase [Pseudothermotoga sp.]